MHNVCNHCCNIPFAPLNPSESNSNQMVRTEWNEQDADCKFCDACKRRRVEFQNHGESVVDDFCSRLFSPENTTYTVFAHKGRATTFNCPSTFVQECRMQYALLSRILCSQKSLRKRFRCPHAGTNLQQQKWIVFYSYNHIPVVV